MKGEPGWVGTADLSRLLGVSRPYVQRKCAGHEWPHRRIGVRIAFSPDDVEWITDRLAVERAEPVPDPSGVVSINRPRKRYPTFGDPS